MSNEQEPLWPHILGIFIMAIVLVGTGNLIGLHAIGVAAWLLYTWFAVLGIADMVNRKKPRKM